MDKKYLQSVYDYLYDKRQEYNFADRKQKVSIESQVKNHSGNLDAELYFLLNENAASGLFRGSSFESDLNHCISILKSMLDSE